uniref:Uncharacterized protein n=1 Tax=Psilocybe cubensis TaxID=181762 RepID=A0A8H8CM84_PSICU
MIIESSALYSFVLLGQAVITAIPSFYLTTSVVNQIDSYWGLALIITPGMSAAILVARISVTDISQDHGLSASINHIPGMSVELVESALEGN